VEVGEEVLVLVHQNLMLLLAEVEAAAAIVAVANLEQQAILLQLHLAKVIMAEIIKQATLILLEEEEVLAEMDQVAQDHLAETAEQEQQIRLLEVALLMLGVEVVAQAIITHLQEVLVDLVEVVLEEEDRADLIVILE